MKTSELKAKLRGLGRRMTPVRLAIIEVVGDDHHAHTAAEILAELKRGGVTPNKTTVYREIEALCADRILRAIHVAGAPVAVEVATDDDHHHAVCTSCHSVTEIDFPHDFKNVERRLSTDNGFTVQSHTVVFNGLCAQCR